MQVTADGPTPSIFDFSGTEGLETVRSFNSSNEAQFNQLPNIVDLGLENLTERGGVPPDVTVQYEDDEVEGDSDVQNMMVDNSNAGLVTFTNASDDGSVETLNLEATGDGSEIQEIVSQMTLSTVNVSGEAAVKITNPFETSVDTVDASENTGGVEAILDERFEDISVTGGDGDDTFTFIHSEVDGSNQDVTFAGGMGNDDVTFDSALLDTDDVLAGGEGVDTLQTTLDELVAVEDVAEEDENVTGFEVIEVADVLREDAVVADDTEEPDAFDASIFEGATTFQLEEGYEDGVVITNLNSETDAEGNTVDQEVAIESDSAGNDLTLEVMGAEKAEDNDLSVTIGAEGDDDDIDAGNVTMNEVESLTLTSNGTDNVNTEDVSDSNKMFLSQDALNSLTIVGSGDLELETVIQDTDAMTESVDASAATGDLDLESVNTEGAAEIMGGTGDDILFGGNGADTLTGNGGENSFVYYTRGESRGENTDTITDFVSGDDQFDFSGYILSDGRALSDAITEDNFFAGNHGTFGAAQGAITESGTTDDPGVEAVYQQEDGVLWLDDNNDGTLNANDLQIRLDDVGSLDADDFILEDGGGGGGEDPVVDPDQSFDIAEDAPNGDDVGTVAATDPDGTVDSYDFVGGNEDVDGDGTPAFSINDDGLITVADTDDLIEGGTSDPFNLEVEVTDNDGQTGQGTVEVDITTADGGGGIVLEAGTTTEVSATDAEDTFVFDATAAQDETDNTQIPIANFDTTADSLDLSMGVSSDASNLDELDGTTLADGNNKVDAQYNSITDETSVLFGPDANGDIISLELQGVSDLTAVDVNVTQA